MTTNMMSTQACSSTDSPAYQLLTLPGEIRNRIYHFALNDSDTEPKPPELDSEQVPAELPFPFHGQATDWRRFQRLWRGQTQASRQIRSEFLSMYADHQIHIELRDLDAYLKHRILQAGLDPVCADLETIKGNVEVHVTEGPEIEFYDALMLLRRMPNMSVEFNRHWQQDALFSYYLLNGAAVSYAAEKAYRVQLEIESRHFQFPEASTGLAVSHVKMVSFSIKPEFAKVSSRTDFDLYQMLT